MDDHWTLAPHVHVTAMVADGVYHCQYCVYKFLMHVKTKIFIVGLGRYAQFLKMNITIIDLLYIAS